MYGSDAKDRAERLTEFLGRLRGESLGTGSLYEFRDVILPLLPKQKDELLARFDQVRKTFKSSLTHEMQADAQIQALIKDLDAIQ